MRRPRRAGWGLWIAAALVATTVRPGSFDGARHPVPRGHPRLLGSAEELRAMARARPDDYRRMRAVAGNEGADDYSWILSASLAAAVEGDADLAARVRQRAIKIVEGPIRVGHVTFGTDLALCGFAYDLCHEAWSAGDREKFHAYFNRTVDANVRSETSVFHNAWYGYKNWGIGVAAYACYHENPRAAGILRTLEEDYRTRAAPALELAGNGGGWAEGYYVHYWLYEWLFFCEVARRCEGVDYLALAPSFYESRAVAAAFETYPGIREYGTRRSVPMGDGGGRLFGGDRDKDLSARRILVSRFGERPDHQAVRTFNETTPRSGVGNYAYKDFLWRDPAGKGAPVATLPLSHVSPGAGFVYARSSWEDDATYFFFKCGDRFTAHQHLDVNHFVVFKHEELAGDGGHYDEFGTTHDVNYHLRSIAHNTMLVLDPDAPVRADIRAGTVTGRDGGQDYPWPHHNGATSDVADWRKQEKLCDIADLLAFEDRGTHLYVAGDGTRAYASNTVACFTRQVVFLRPDTFVIFDRVEAVRPGFRKTWLLQAMKTPARSDGRLVITHGRGRLFVQTLLPAEPDVRLVSGEDLYRYGGRSYPPRKDTGPAPECRVEISPARPQQRDFFLHVLTAASSETATMPTATARTLDDRVEVSVGGAQIEFLTARVGGGITLDGKRADFADGIRPAPASALRP